MSDEHTPVPRKKTFFDEVKEELREVREEIEEELGTDFDDIGRKLKREFEPQKARWSGEVQRVRNEVIPKNDPEGGVFEPVRRGARKFGVGVGRFISALLVIFSLMFLTGGAILVALTSGVVQFVGIVMLALGAMAGVGGGVSAYALGRFNEKANDEDVRRMIRQVLADADKSLTDAHIAKTLNLPLNRVQSIAGQLAREGKIHRDVELQSGAEVYRSPDHDEFPDALSALDEFTEHLDWSKAREREVAAAGVRSDDRAPRDATVDELSRVETPAPAYEDAE